MQIGDLIKKQQFNRLKKNSVRHHQAKRQGQKSRGSKLSQRRQKLNLSLAQLSMLTGINQITLKRWETNGMNPDDKISLIRKYAKVMHLNLQKLVTDIVNQ